MAKRRFISLLPNFQQTVDLRNFFGSTVDQVFQPGRSQPVSGYIGRRTGLDTQDFYVGEPSASRAAYQLESAMVSQDENGDLTEVLSYPDFVGYLETNGANVSDHQRLFETEYYSWCPPVNIDMLVNYRNYYWFGDDVGIIDLPILTLTVPYLLVTADGITQTFDLPDSIKAIALADEAPGVYVNNIPVSFSINDDNTVTLDASPAAGSDVLIARVPDLAKAITGMDTVDISDLNEHNVTVLTSGMRIEIIDAIHIIGAWDAQPWDYNLWDLSGSRIYMVDGIGQALRLTFDEDLLHGIIPQYVTIDRTSRDNNLFSLHNLWVHKDSFAWSKASFYVPLTEREARRPIIEFIRDLVLWQQVEHLQTSAFNSNTKLTFDRDMPNIIGSSVTGPNIPRNTIVTNVQHATVTLSQALTGNITPDDDIMFTQVWSESVDPKFMLYNLDDQPLNDAIRYPNSNFIGSRIFGYSLSTTSPIDPILLRRLAFDQLDYILFDNLTVTERYLNESGTIDGLYAYATHDTSMVYESLWHSVAATTAQGISNGFYDVPLNLQANPASDDVQTISRSTWIDHFRTLIDRQVGIEGQSLGNNNYRDTARDLTFGRSILQHRAPLLKAMLLAANIAYDLPQAIRFVDQEYNRFRNKFARKLVELRNNGTLTEANAPTEWVNTTLKAIKRDKNNQFPFALSTVAGDQFFIPPTPTCLGILPAAQPTMVIDPTYAMPVLMILGHDGSFTPAFNDWRDPIMLALEQTIFDNLPMVFRTAERPGFDIHQWIDSRFSSPFNSYTRDEVSNMLAPWFELWAQQNRFDYRTNTGFDQNNPFTWNYRDVLDRSGNALPGNWRAIYRWYYGTDAPHLRPWEMLGFVSEPIWWQATYGKPPYVRTSQMWYDLEHGIIQAGQRVGTDETYTRIGLADFIPVDADGNLLDPIGAGIVDLNIIVDTASRSWLVGDHGPVENLWLNSPSYRFAQALIGFLMKPARFVEQCWDTLHIGYKGTQWVDLPSCERPLNAKQYLHGETVNDTTVRITGISQWISDYLVSSGHTSDVLGGAVRGLDVRLIHQMAGFTSNDIDMKIIADNFGLVPQEDIDSVLYTSPSTRTELYSGVILEWTGRSWRVIGYDAGNPYFTIIKPNVNGPKGLISLANADEPAIVKWHPNTYYPKGILADNLNTVWECIRGHTSTTIFEQHFWLSRPDLNMAMVRAPRVITYLNGADTAHVPYGTEFLDYQSVADFLLGWQRWLKSRGWIFDTIDEQTGLIRDWSLSVREFLSWAQVQWSPGNFIALSPGQQELKFSTPTGTILNVENAVNGFFGLIDRSGRPIRQRDSVINRLDGDITILAKHADIFAARLGLADIEHALIFKNKTIFDDNIYLPLFNQRQSRLRLNCKRSTDWTGRLDAPGFIITGNKLLSDFEKAAEDVRLMFDIEKSDRSDLRDYARHVIGFQRRDYLDNLLISNIEQFEFYQGMIQQKGAPGVFEKLTRSIRASNNSNLQFLEEWAVRVNDYGAPIDPFMIFQLRQTDQRDHPQLVRLVPTIDAPLTWIVFSSLDPRWIDRPTSTDFFTMRTDYAPSLLPTAGPVRLSDVNATAFYLSEIPDLYTVAQEASQIPFPTGFSTWVYERADGTYTVLRSFETGNVPNAILTVLTNKEDATITTTRIIFQQPITLTTADIGNYLVIDGLSLTDPELSGLVVISDVDVEANCVDLDVVGQAGHDFMDHPSDAPYVRVLREVRFANRAAVTASEYIFAINDLIWIDADETSPLISVSDAVLSPSPGASSEFKADLNGGDEVMGGFTSSPQTRTFSFAGVNVTRQWAVLQWNGTTWDTVRNQPHRVDTSTISETVIYHAGTKVVDRQMIIDEPVIDELIVIDPLNDLIAGLAEREIEYEVGYDPASYNAGTFVSNNPWGPREVGQVWWNLATVKFLDPYTDILDASNERDITELTYRRIHWAQIAPGSSVDVYEWIESDVDPTTYVGPGTIYNSLNPSWSEQIVYSIQYGRDITRYYFWVKGLTAKPELPFRHTDITTVAMAIENPSGLDLPWMAPISQDALIVNGIAQYLDDTSTVMKVKLTIDPESAGRHDEWQLLRATDETSLPSDFIWQKLRDSLAGFDITGHPVPDPSLNPMRATGIRQSQGMFAVDGLVGSGILAARQSFVGIVNAIFNRTPLWRNRGTIVNSLYHSTPMPLPVLNNETGQMQSAPLAWSQTDQSAVFEPPPHNEWDLQVYSLVQRNRLLGRVDFVKARTTGKRWRVLLNGIGQPRKQWSIWEFDPFAANRLIAANPLRSINELLIENADQVFTLATAYDVVVHNRSARNDLSGSGYGVGPYGIGPYAVSGTVTIGQRVLVIDDTAKFWAIWKFLPSDATADTQGFVLWRVQSYNTHDFITTIDWYAAGYFPNKPPIVIYDTITARNKTEGLSPSNQFVKVIDDGSPTHGWVWTNFDTTANQWVVVAMQNGTIKLTDGFYNPVHVPHGVDYWRPLAKNAAVSVTTLTFADTSGFAVGQFINGPGLDRNTKIAAIDGNIVRLDIPTVAVIHQETKLVITNLSIRDISIRDGSWELYVLADLLRYGAFLTDAEINEIFFSVLNFVHTQQDSIDWAIKTSFMTIFGYNVPLTQTPVLMSDQTQSLISYINEVKPYHVKVRDFSTQYNTDISNANTNLVEDTAFDVTILFDRYTSGVDGWDMESWDTSLWDGGETSISTIFAHTVVVQTLEIAASAIQVDDIRLFLNLIDIIGLSPVSETDTLTVRINANAYQINKVLPDTVNISTVVKSIEFTANAHISDKILTIDALISGTVVVGQLLSGGNVVAGTTITGTLGLNTYSVSVAQTVAATMIQGQLVTQQGLSGQLITSGVFDVADGIKGTIVEAILMMPNAANRIVQHYEPTEDMPDDDLTMLLSLDPKAVFAGYDVIVSAGKGATELTLAHTNDISVKQPVFGPNIVTGTTVTAVTTSTITLSHPLTHDLLAVAPITVGMPTHIAGDILYTNTPFYTYDGNASADDVSINPALASRPGGFDLRSPYHTANHPEERLPFNGDDTFHISVNAMPTAGAPPQLYKAFDVSHLTTSATLYFDMLAQSAAGVIVMRNGVRAIADRDYSVDHFARTVTVQLLTDTKRIAVHAFGIGGLSAITDAFYLAYSSNPVSIPAATTKANVDIVIDGKRLSPANFTVNDTAITLSSPPPVGTDTAIMLYSQGVNTATLISVQQLLYEISHTWSLIPNDSITIPEHAGTIVELNGRRLTPPYTFYGNFTSSKNWMYLPIMPASTTIYTVYVEGVVYPNSIPVATSTDPSSPYPFHLYLPPGQVPPTNVTGRFVFFDNKMVALDTKFTTNTVAVVLNDTGFPNDYTVSGGRLTVNVPVSSSDDLVATVFSNAGSMGIRTAVYPANLTSYPISLPMLPINKQYTMVSMNGLALVPDLDYQIRYFNDDTALLDLLIKPPTGYIVITCFTGKIAHETQQWLNVSRTSAMTRMPPVLDVSGEPILNDDGVALYHVLDECLGLSPNRAGKLAVALTPDDNQITINLFLHNTSPKLVPPTPLDIPDILPGVIWIGSERIEYFHLSRVNDVVTLHGLRRATRGTSITEQRQVIIRTGDGRSHNYTLTGIGVVEVMVDDVRHDFTSQIVGDNTTVAITADVGSFVTISMTTGYVYQPGTVIYKGTKIACDPTQRLSPTLRYGGGPTGVGGVGQIGQLVPLPITGFNISEDFTKTLPVGWTFTRSSANATNCTYLDGPTVTTFTTYAANQPRILSFGLLMEPARTNYYLNSEAPPQSMQSISLAVGTYTLWFNGSANSTMQVMSASATITPDLQTVTLGVPFTFTVTAAGIVYFSVGNTTVTRVQIENGPNATSYIQSGATPATRAEDRLSKNYGAQLNASQGTYWVEWMPTSQTIDERAVLMTAGAGSYTSGNNTDGMYVLTSSAQSGTPSVTGIVTNAGGSYSVAPEVPLPKVGSISRIAMSVSLHNVQIACDYAMLKAVDPNFRPASMLTVTLGGGGASGNPVINGFIRGFKYWSVAIPDIALNECTRVGFYSGPPVFSIDVMNAVFPRRWTQNRGTTQGVMTDGYVSDASGSTYNTFPSAIAPRFTSRGLLLENTRANYMASSNVPISRATPALPVSGFRLWMIGTGSARIDPGTATSGIGMGATATQGKSVYFQPASTGTVNVTLTGSVDRFQFEGPLGVNQQCVGETTFIQTIGGGQVRGHENISTPVGNYFNGNARSYYIEWISDSLMHGGVLFTCASSDNTQREQAFFMAADPTQPDQPWALYIENIFPGVYDPAIVFPNGSIVPHATNKLVITKTTSMTFAALNGVLLSQPALGVTKPQPAEFRINGFGGSPNGFGSNMFRKFAFYDYAIPDSQLVAMTDRSKDPTLEVSFLTGILDSRVTLGRATVGTYFDVTGVLQTAGNNVPRFDYDPMTHVLRGLLIEEQRQNTTTSSASAQSWGFSAVTVTANAILAPDGTVTAGKVIPTAVSAQHAISLPGAKTITAGLPATCSVFVKPAGYNRVGVVFNNTAFTSGMTANFDVSNGTLIGSITYLGTGSGGSYTITPLPNGWYRVALTGIVDATSTGTTAFLYIDSLGVYTGDGTSGLYLWGAQVEVGATVTSYIPTTTVAVTRATDFLTMATPWLNATTGTLFTSVSLASWNATGGKNCGLFQLDDGASNRQNSITSMAFTNANVSMQLISTITVANITTGSLGYSNLNVAGSPMNSAVAWSSTTIAQSVNGNVTQSGAVSNLPTPSRLVIGNGFTGIVALGGYFRKLTYWPRTMSNTELQQATTP